MSANPWSALNNPDSSGNQCAWLQAMLARNADTAYLKQFGSPRTVESFRRQLPLSSYADLLPCLARIQAGESDVLFQGKPIAYERTGGSTGGSKLIPYSEAGLVDFQRCIVPWLAETVQKYGITGRAYFSISPVSRKPELIAGVPVGLADGAYLGEQAGRILAQQSAVPLAVGQLQDFKQWRDETVAHLRRANDLELISVWSPTFLLKLLDEIPDAAQCWPRLKIISCWASGSAQRYAKELRQRLPDVEIQAKGLLSTEAVVTVPDANGRPVLVQHGFVEFAAGNEVWLESELAEGAEYEVVLTTASGLYRYQTGDRVRFAGRNQAGRAVLEFVGRDALTSDLVGEKLTETFVNQCLDVIPGFAMLVPDPAKPGYVLVCAQTPSGDQVAKLEKRLDTNPQYAYARQLGQLAPLRVLPHPAAFSILERSLVDRGVRLGDIKPLALRSEPFWIALFEDALP